MKQYESRARKIAQDRLFKEGTRHPWMQDASINDKAPEVSSRVQIFEFKGDHKDKTKWPESYDGALDLIQFWEDNDHSEVVGTENRRLFIVENMDPLVLELLGVKLNIPPEVFLAHCDPFVNLGVLDNQWEMKSPSTYWRVAVPQMRRIASGEIRPPAGHYYIESGRVDRLEIEITDTTHWVTFFGQVSCWATRYGEGNRSWTAVLLVDPHEIWLRHQETYKRSRLDDYFPNRRTYAEASIDRESGSYSHPYERSLYDAIVGAHSSSGERTGSLGPATEDPFSATTFSRRLIHAAWADFLWREDFDFRDLVLDDEITHHLCQGNNALKPLESGVDARTVEKYQRLIEIRNDVKRWKWHMNSIMWSFGARVSTYSGIVDKDHGLWEKLEEKLTRMEAEIAEHMDMFSQRATMEESFAAKQQARSAGQLTIIATIVVPCTFVASVLSMGGEFAAGQPLFGVYWAITIPATLVLLVWVLYESNETRPKFQQLKGQLKCLRLRRTRASPADVDEEQGRKQQ
ncbi:hypothetical protein M406DRAFT_268370 [Cryphonectria parasitica EP155]|uniref:Uncharacterized protein n=1 Tax=Cryphonectria parasitica (strain ATCC 38755 / EP155) TaxID=660469 RepID=A0A9P4XTA7_CRYP1|nr:uncharacterized protein M406DRAFT_268370 [Cryphonectria parasitica EP155]KAF3760852.1 hypothetical protein M406DRAFT_268370 [Cryphonectria parasitica EP155]